MKSNTQHICHIITTFIVSSGSTRRTLVEIHDQVQSGYRVGLIVGGDVSLDLLRDCREYGIDVYRVVELRKHIDLVADIKSVLKIYKIIKQKQFDLVHTHLAKAGIVGRIAAKLAHVPTIMHTVHGPSFPDQQGWLRHAFRFLEKLVGNFTQGTIFVGRELRDQYVEALVTPLEKAYIIYTGRDFSKYRHAYSMSSCQVKSLREELGIPLDAIVVGYVARIVPSKGHQVAIEAFRLLKKDFPHLKMTFIGKANLPREESHLMYLQKVIGELKLEGEIQFLGYRSNVECYYRLMDIFILPSYYEGLPNVIVEAVSMAVPVVAFDCGGVREVLELCPGAGHVVEPHDFNGLVQRLKEVIVVVQKQKRSLGEKPEYLDTLSQVWSTSVMLEQTKKLYSLLDGRQKSV